VEGNRVVWAAVRDGAPGRWRTQPADGAITWEQRAGRLYIEIREVDGSMTRRDYAPR
jgi:hypothetical protein